MNYKLIHDLQNTLNYGIYKSNYLAELITAIAGIKYTWLINCLFN